MIELRFSNDTVEQFSTVDEAISRVSGLTLTGDKLFDGKVHLTGMNDGAVAMYAGKRVEGEDKNSAEAEAKEFATSGLTFLEHQYKKGRISDSQLKGGLTKVKANIQKAESQKNK